MKNSIPTPVILAVIAVVLVIAVVFGMRMMSGPASLSQDQVKVPDFIDPVTQKPKAGMTGSSSGGGPQGAPSGGTSGGR